MATKETRTVKVSRNLKCNLTDERLRELGDIAAFIDADIEKLQSEKKQFIQQNKADLDAVKARQRELLQKIRDKAEHRHTECVETFDYRINEVVVARVDTGEEVSRRAMSSEERSKTVLPGFEPKASKDEPANDSEETEEPAPKKKTVKKKASKK
jgi:hypothetical protein